MWPTGAEESKTQPAQALGGSCPHPPPPCSARLPDPKSSGPTVPRVSRPQSLLRPTLFPPLRNGGPLNRFPTAQLIRRAGDASASRPGSAHAGERSHGPRARGRAALSNEGGASDASTSRAGHPLFYDNLFRAHKGKLRTRKEQKGLKRREQRTTERELKLRAPRPGPSVLSLP